jgi:hypothetical protein
MHLAVVWSEAVGFFGVVISRKLALVVVKMFSYLI